MTPTNACFTAPHNFIPAHRIPLAGYDVERFRRTRELIIYRRSTRIQEAYDRAWPIAAQQRVAYYGQNPTTISTAAAYYG